MEININCDLGEKSKHHSNKYDPDLLEIVNSANVQAVNDNILLKEVTSINLTTPLSFNFKTSDKQILNDQNKYLSLLVLFLQKLLLGISAII